jgi:hypothetical protein
MLGSTIYATCKSLLSVIKYKAFIDQSINHRRNCSNTQTMEQWSNQNNQKDNSTVRDKQFHQQYQSQPYKWKKCLKQRQ